MIHFRRRKFLLFALGFGILLWMIAAAGPNVLWQNICKVRWWILALVAVWGLGYLLNAASWAAIIGALGSSGEAVSGGQGRSLSFGRICQFTVSGFAINYITPFGLLGGEPYRVWALRPYVGMERAASSVLLYLMMHVCSHFFFWIAASVTALWVLDFSASFRIGIGVIVAVLILFIALFFRGYHNGMVLSFFRALGRWPLIGRRVEAWRQRNRERLLRIDGGIATLLRDHARAFWTSLALEFLSRLVNCLEIAVILRVLAPGLSPFSEAPVWLLFVSFFIVAFSSLFANILFFSPLQMGTREGGIFLALQTLWPAVAAPALMPLAVSISVLTRIREFVWIAVGLLLTLPGLRRS